jgi:hypothetical protein
MVALQKHKEMFFLRNYKQDGIQTVHEWWLTKYDFFPEQIGNQMATTTGFFFFNKGPYGKIKKSFFLETTNIRIMIRWAKKGFCELLVLI